MKARLVLHKAIAFAAPLAISCSADPELESWQGEHLEYLWESSLRPCDGVPEQVDAMVPHVAGQLDLDPGGFKRISYVWLTLETFEGLSGAAPGSVGFASRGEIYSWAPSLQHEVVHAVVHQERVGGLSFLNEGIAVAIAAGDYSTHSSGGWGPSPRFVRVDPRPHLRDQSDEDGAEYYAISGGFVAYLLSRYGPNRLLELHRCLSRNSSAARFERYFEELYGRSLDAEVEDFLSMETCPEDASATPAPFSCSSETIQWASEDHWQDSRVMTCHAGHSTQRAPTESVTVAIPTDGWYSFSVFGDSEAGVYLLSCEPCPWLAKDSLLPVGEHDLPLKAGLYSVIYRPGLQETGLVGLSIDPSDSF